MHITSFSVIMTHIKNFKPVFSSENAFIYIFKHFLTFTQCGIVVACYISFSLPVLSIQFELLNISDVLSVKLQVFTYFSPECFAECKLGCVKMRRTL